MIAHKLPNEQKSKLRIGLFLENQVTKSEIKDPKIEEIERLKELVKNMPDLRENKVKAVKMQLQSGEYKISPEMVSQRFIELYEEICNEGL